MAPSSGITDTLGLYPADTSGSGEKLPSFGENIQNKQYLDALYQGLGLAGDAMYASTPFTGAVGILGGTALKGMGAIGKASKLAKAQNLINQGKATAGTARATEKLMEPTNIKSGTIVDVRRNLNSKIDDPELERFKVQTIHGVATKGGKATKAESSIGTGPTLSYDASVTVRADEAPIELNVNQKARDQIASRTKPKFPMAAVRGEHAPTGNFNPDLVLKFNPMKQNVFVDDSGYGVKAIKNGKATIVDNDVMVKLDNPESFRTIKDETRIN